MYRQSVTICNKLGMHARAAAKFVQLASRYESEIKISREAKEVNGKSIMGVMMLAAGKGTSIDIVGEGPDARQAVDDLAQLVKDRFGEAE
ncbi:MAG: HPr-like protein Crh [Gammaproteobacteria bacterium]|nr:HPr-like protein Crh [Gammaproteobacteria bacterium]